MCICYTLISEPAYIIFTQSHANKLWLFFGGKQQLSVACLLACLRLWKAFIWNYQSARILLLHIVRAFFSLLSSHFQTVINNLQVLLVGVRAWFVLWLLWPLVYTTVRSRSGVCGRICHLTLLIFCCHCIWLSLFVCVCVSANIADMHYLYTMTNKTLAAHTCALKVAASLLSKYTSIWQRCECVNFQSHAHTQA